MPFNTVMRSRAQVSDCGFEPAYQGGAAVSQLCV